MYQSTYCWWSLTSIINHQYNLHIYLIPSPNIGLGVWTNKFFEFWWIYVFSRVYPENHQGGPNCQRKQQNFTTKITWDDSRRLQETLHRRWSREAEMWGRPAYGVHQSVSPLYVGFPPPPRLQLRHYFKLVWSEGPELMLRPIYIALYPSLKPSLKP
jgi:hypothetical protein